jgi:hypothetical protein
VAGRDLDAVAGETKGVLLAVLSLDDGAAVFAGMGEGEREHCSRAWAALVRLEEAAMGDLFERWRAELATGLPSGLARLHPSWIEDALAGEPPHLLALLRGCLPASRPGSLPASLGSADHRSGLRSDLARVAFGHLAPLCENPAGPLATSLSALPFEALMDEVGRLGARTLARSLAGSEPAVRARAMAVAGEPWATVMAQAFGQAASRPVSEDERQAAVAQVAGSVALPAHTPGERLLHIGMATLAADLAAEHPGSRFRVAGRLPAQLGRRLLGW